MTDISTRVWLDEKLWEALRRRAVAEGTTARDLIPRLLGRALAEGRAGAQASVAAAPVAAPAESVGAAGPSVGTPVVPLVEAYICGVCGEELKPSRLSAHLGKHVREQQAG